MFNLMNGSCPYQNWTNVAKERCPNPVNFHCLKDEYGRIGWVCSEPVWVEKDRCPVYNVIANKLDTTSCLQTRCPLYNYRSNDIDVEYACRYITDRESSTKHFTTKSPEMNKNSSCIVITLTMLTLVTIVIVTAILILKYRKHYFMSKKSSKNTELRQEESKDLMQGTALETNSSDQANHSLVKNRISVITEVQGSGRKKSSRNIESRQKESKELLQQTAIDKLTTTEEPTNSFDQAKHFLLKERMVVITGVQGSGKTFLAKSLFKSLLQDGNIKDSILISSLSELHFGPSEKIDLYIIDDIFYELQLYEKFRESLEALTDFLDNAKRTKTYFIITIPSYTWKCHGYEFDAHFDKVQVDLDKRKESEKLDILESLKARYNLSREVSEGLSELQDDLMITFHECIGFPALVSWMCKQPSAEKLNRCLCFPLQTIRDEMSSIKNAKTIEEKGKFLLLSYLCLKGGKMNLENVDRILFDALKKKYAPEFEDKELANYCKDMVGYFLLDCENSCFEIDLNIMKKVVCVCLAKESTEFVEDYRKHDFFKYVVKKECCPRGMDTWYTECFTMI